MAGTPRFARVVFGLAVASTAALAADSPRHEWSLDQGWRSVADDDDGHRTDGFEQPGFDDSAWSAVDVPHNWDDYGGEHRLVHGNRHGTAWYRRTFQLAANERGRRVWLYFEGVGSYATVWVNGKPAGKHAGGRTTFTLDVTGLANFGATNTVAVRADHPAGITDLPWVCGGCSTTPGFSEGSQPMGIFRPVHLLTTNDVRITPFGVHVWNDADATSARAKIHFTVELENHGAARALTIENRILNRDHPIKSVGAALAPSLASPKANGTAQAPPLHPTPKVVMAEISSAAPEGTSVVRGELELRNVALWSLASPTLYTLETTVRDGGRVLDRVETTFGVRTIHWPDPKAPASAPFLLNGQPVFINGTCEYEHLLGASHAFGAGQIRARVAQIRAAGFNAVRDAHQPHNLRYQEYWDRDGLLWWPQFAAQIWFDTPAFRANFKALLRDWVRERRNSPSLVLWGLANESKLPEDFAAECVALIRELDPTSPSQRLVTTCNSGKGTDWNVPQNWSGTYGGKPDEYADDLLRQRLVGEYGAWRSLGLHTEGGFVRDGPLSEERATALLEKKVRLAESVRDRVPGHFQWLFATHDNPGRVINAKMQQGGDGWPELDRIGPANNKGLLTLWGEPTDAFYMYRANYAPAATDPMVYIVSHTWPDRWQEPADDAVAGSPKAAGAPPSSRRSGIVVYSNCEEVELFNDVGDRSLGVRRRSGPGTHFQWDDVEITTNVLYAEARVGGRVVATDAIVLQNLPTAPRRAALNRLKRNTLQTDRRAAGSAGADFGEPEKRAAEAGVAEAGVVEAGAVGQNYLYRVNCGGEEYVDTHGQRWLADAGGKNWQSISWAARYGNVPPDFGSRRMSHEAVRGTANEELYQSYRYGRHALRYRFAVPDGDYRVELYFMEPWYGAGGGDCTGWRLFDVAVNDTTVLHDVDLWKEAGFAGAVKKVVMAKVSGGVLTVSFPRVASYQAVISAIAISTTDAQARAPEFIVPEPVLRETAGESSGEARGEAKRQVLPVAAARRIGDALVWSVELGLGGRHEFQVRYVTTTGENTSGELTLTAGDGTPVGSETIDFAPTRPDGTALTRRVYLSTNAGDYTVTVRGIKDPVRVEALIVQ